MIADYWKDKFRLLAWENTQCGASYGEAYEKMVDLMKDYLTINEKINNKLTELKERSLNARN